MRGRPPKHPAIRLVEGNAGKRPIPPVPAVGVADPPSCPRWLSAAAKTEWNFIVKHLMVYGLVTKLDRMALARYASWSARYIEAEKAMQAEELVIEDKRKSVKLQPLLRVIRMASEEMRRIEDGFGMTPISRLRLHAAPPADDGDALDGLSRRRRPSA